MTMEAVRGGEAYNFDRNYPDYAPWHNAILPFTRNVVGSMDYTPVSFSDVTYPHKTTYAHELALGVLFESGIQHFADKFESYLEQPDFVINYLKNIPVVWDETRFVTGYPGELVVLARRSGDSWYVSGINGLTSPRDVELTLDFLPAGDYTLTLIADGATDRSFALQTLGVTSGEAISLSMRARGGFAGVINGKR
jgi:alpha-glucosidase